MPIHAEPQHTLEASINFKWLPYISLIALVTNHISILEPTGCIIWSSIIKAQLYCTEIKWSSFYGRAIQFKSCSPLKALAAIKIFFTDSVTVCCHSVLVFYCRRHWHSGVINHWAKTSHGFDMFPSDKSKATFMEDNGLKFLGNLRFLPYGLWGFTVSVSVNVLRVFQHFSIALLL